MNDKINKIVGGKHTILITIIICLLIICFLYWLSCCKNRSLVDKVRGGEVGFVVCDEGICYKCIGMTITDAEHPFYVLSLEGEKWFNDKSSKCFAAGTSKFYQYFGNVIKNLFNEPVNLINGEHKNGRTVQRINSDAKNLINSDSDDIPNCFDMLRTKTVFHFGSCFENRNNEIIEYYNKMIGVITSFGGDYVDEALFIGQPASKPKKTLDKSELYALIRLSNLGEHRISGDISDRLNEYIRSLHDVCMKYARDWYGDTAGMNDIVKHGYCCDDKGEIQKKLNVGKKGYEVGDIFPAKKLVMMVIFLISLYSKCFKSYSFKEYVNMIASYVVYANLFNSWCAVKMEGKWNTDIGNKYVYVYKKQNGRQRMEINERDIKVAGWKLNGEDAENWTKEEALAFFEASGQKARHTARSVLDEISPSGSQRIDERKSEEEMRDKKLRKKLMEMNDDPNDFNIFQKSRREKKKPTPLDPESLKYKRVNPLDFTPEEIQKENEMMEAMIGVPDCRAVAIFRHLIERIEEKNDGGEEKDAKD